MIGRVPKKLLGSFILKLSAFALLVFCLDFATGTFLKKIYFKQKSGFDWQTNYAINETKADLLIFGSSRAANIFDPEILGSALNMSCYNAGRAGFSILYHYPVLQVITKRHTPKLVILSIDAGGFSINTDAYDRLSSLLPYYETHNEIKSAVDLKSRYEKFKVFSKTYPYNSMLLPILSGLRKKGNAKFATQNGFIPLHTLLTDSTVYIDYSKELQLDSVKVNIYKSFLQYCIINKIPLFITCPPYKLNSTGVDRSITKAKEIAVDYKIPFLDFSRDTIFTNHINLFADVKHLNDIGVPLLNKQIIDSIVFTRK